MITSKIQKSADFRIELITISQYAQTDTNTSFSQERDMEQVEWKNETDQMKKERRILWRYGSMVSCTYQYGS
jgi:hypothetical protein